VFLRFVIPTLSEYGREARNLKLTNYIELSPVSVDASCAGIKTPCWIYGSRCCIESRDVVPGLRGGGAVGAIICICCNALYYIMLFVW
jgi:hypothetical protein